MHSRLSWAASSGRSKTLVLATLRACQTASLPISSIARWTPRLRSVETAKACLCERSSIWSRRLWPSSGKSTSRWRRPARARSAAGLRWPSIAPSSKWRYCPSGHLSRSMRKMSGPARRSTQRGACSCRRSGPSRSSRQERGSASASGSSSPLALPILPPWRLFSASSGLAEAGASVVAAASGLGSGALALRSSGAALRGSASSSEAGKGASPIHR